MQVTTIGLDIAKHVFQVHGIDQDGQVIIRRQIQRSEVMGFFQRLPPCLIGMEACATAHFWARELAAFGHEVRLMPAAYVLERFAAFVVIGACFGLGYPKHRLAILLVVIGIVGALEVAQLLVPTRHGRLPDMFVKAAGALLGLAAPMISGRAKAVP